MGIHVNLIVVYIANLLVVLFILRRYAAKPVMKMLDDRQEKIAVALEVAERTKQEAELVLSVLREQIEEERAENQRRFEEITARSEMATRSALNEAKVEADRIIAQARGEAERVHKRLKEEEENLIRSAVERFTDYLARRDERVVASSSDRGVSKN